MIGMPPSRFKLSLLSRAKKDRRASVRCPGYVSGFEGPSRPYTTTREAEERFHLHAQRMRHNTAGTAGDRNLWGRWLTT
ncbi:hypothetical protein H9L39_03496 [Fusarium oxysporum f. sp. albedinis]|nr:hypothetical protein H9L39_03496 [Fusarium oxysporum f. sp. albedinis]